MTLREGEGEDTNATPRAQHHDLIFLALYGMGPTNND